MKNAGHITGWAILVLALLGFSGGPFGCNPSPLVGFWKETAQIACGTGNDVDPLFPILELKFDERGRFGVTWIPFETFVDYWGTYSYDEAQGTIRLTVDGGNFIPSDFDGIGTFSFDLDGQLVLEDVWLGIQQFSEGPSAITPGCGHRFRAFGSGT